MVFKVTLSGRSVFTKSILYLQNPYLDGLFPSWTHETFFSSYLFEKICSDKLHNWFFFFHELLLHVDSSYASSRELLSKMTMYNFIKCCKTLIQCIIQNATKSYFNQLKKLEDKKPSVLPFFLGNSDAILRRPQSKNPYLIKTIEGRCEVSCIQILEIQIQNIDNQFFIVVKI